MGIKVTAVQVNDIDAAANIPGAFCYDAQRTGMFYICPCGCRQEGYLRFRPGERGKASWHWDGNEKCPTLTPSVHHIIGPFGDGRPQKTHWHGYLRNGIWEET